ncbi:DivIVA domain-containing protein [Motilibacter sp. E257]|uniref:DivIVA domain-containing protein n=1 Tax=Motilibacter deserti TaxID=2714956 RepID=A0ABX0GU02_9ACTN|nr:DivIVA domain-containing protein [Motilibacter deserti]
MLFLLLALGVLAAIALVAAGRGDGLSEAEPDVAPVALPSGALTPVDLAEVRFPSALRGYRMADVDAVLDRVAGELAERDARIALLESAAGARPLAVGDDGSMLDDGAGLADGAGLDGGIGDGPGLADRGGARSPEPGVG